MRCSLLVFSGLLLLGGCASPWVSYQEAVRCHLDDKGPECDAKYAKAIKADSKMRGIHSSYGTHLLLQGKADQANQEFQLEQQNYPNESSKAIALLLRPASGAGSAPSTEAPAAVPVDSAATSAPTSLSKPGSTTEVSSKPSKAPAKAATKKGVSHAK